MSQKNFLNEKTFHTLLEKSPVGIVILDDKRCFQFVNNYFSRLIGYTPAELIGRNVRLVYAREEEYVRAGVELYAGVERDQSNFTEIQLRHKG